MFVVRSESLFDLRRVKVTDNQRAAYSLYGSQFMNRFIHLFWLTIA